MRTLCLTLAFILSGCLGTASVEPSQDVALPTPDGPSARPDRVIWERPLPPLRATARPSVDVPESPVIVVDRRQPAASSGAHRVTGSASWYCGHGSRCTRGYPGGLYAAAGPSLRVGHWRGRVVTVAGPMGRTVRVTLIDWCACPNGRVLDLYRDAFSRLANPSVGLVKVTVSW